MTQPPAAAPGWYPTAHANNDLRYWDGSRWHETPPPAPTPTASPGRRPVVASWELPVLLTVAGLFVIFLAFANPDWGPWVGLAGIVASISGLIMLVDTVLARRRARKARSAGES